MKSEKAIVVHVCLTPELLARLDAQIPDYLTRARSAFIRKILVEWLEKVEKEGQE